MPDTGLSFIWSKPLYRARQKAKKFLTQGEPMPDPCRENPMPCGCKAVYADGMSHPPIYVVHCPKHAATDALIAALKLVRRKWTFNNDQQHTHTWHAWADCIKQIDESLALVEKGATE